MIYEWRGAFAPSSPDFGSENIGVKKELRN
jgi:hypothetical protein